MVEFIRMTADRDGAYDHFNIVTYRAGEVYHRYRTDPPISQDLLDGFVASGHAIEVDAQGNPVAIPADKRATKPTGPKATKDATPAPVDTEPPPSAPTANDVRMDRLYPTEDKSTDAQPDPVTPADVTSETPAQDPTTPPAK